MMGTAAPEGLKNRLKKFWPGKIDWDVPLAPYTTFKVGGPAQALVVPESTAEVAILVKGCREEGISWSVIGGGSNLLVADEGFPGVVILMGRELGAISKSGKSGEGKTLVEVEAGCSLARLVNWCGEQQFAGLEFAAGIPGTVGGAVAMNAGAWGREIKDILVSLLLLEDGVITSRSRQELVFGYRCWQRPEGVVVLSATFAFEPGDSARIKENCRKNIEARRTNQPAGQASGGSFFKNPEEGAAGRLMEDAGLKGSRVGGALISEIHANFIVNSGGATAADIIGLMKQARARVKEVHGVTLEPEVQFLGAAPEVLADEK
jgi:UDP-N-acetylmuramate dehydrogenase